MIETKHFSLFVVVIIGMFWTCFHSLFSLFTLTCQILNMWNEPYCSFCFIPSKVLLIYNKLNLLYSYVRFFWHSLDKNRLHAGGIFCLFCLLIYPEPLECCLQFNRVSLNIYQLSIWIHLLIHLLQVKIIQAMNIKRSIKVSHHWGWN